MFSDGGYSLDLSAPILSRAMFHLDNCYLLPHVEVVGKICRTHTVSHTAFRGFGGPQGMLFIEEILDRIARHLKLAPHVVRERNFYEPGDETHYGQPVKDAERIGRIWSELKRSSDYAARLTEISEHNAAHPHDKRGLSITPVKFGISFTTAFFNQAGALVLIYKDGSVQLNHGGTEMGQGLHTKMLQVAADSLGVPLASLRVMATRTDKIPQHLRYRRVQRFGSERRRDQSRLRNAQRALVRGRRPTLQRARLRDRHRTRPGVSERPPGGRRPASRTPCNKPICSAFRCSPPATTKLRTFTSTAKAAKASPFTTSLTARR